MRLGIVGAGVRAIQIVQALQMLEGVEVKPLEFKIRAYDIDQPPSPKLYKDTEPWQRKHKRRRY